MHYFIDGYNLLFRLPQGRRSFEEERHLIVDALIGIKLFLTLVFDGGGDESPRRTHKGPLEIVYTAKGQSADAYILDELSWVKTPETYTVVTSDKKLASACRVLGAKSQSIHSFLSLIRKKQAIKIEEKPIKEADKNLERLLKIFNELSKQYKSE